MPDTFYVRPQRLVVVEGTRRINLLCQGTGSPTVLLDAGAGESMIIWRHVHAALSRTTRTCAYDRAGYGFSDPAMHASDAGQIVDDLVRLVDSAGLERPFVYVGHSAAGAYGTLLIARAPTLIAGAVFVDPLVGHAHEHAVASFSGPERQRLVDYYAATLRFLEQCASRAAAGALRAPTTASDSACIDTRGYRDQISPSLRQLLAQQYGGPAVQRTALSEYGSVWPDSTGQSANDRILDATPARFGDRPVTVLIHDPRADPPFPGLSAASRRAMDSARVADLRALAGRSRNGRAMTVPRSSHHIQIDQPAAVIRAVKDVVHLVRRG